MKKVLIRLFVVFFLVTSSLLVAPFSISADEQVTITVNDIVGVTPFSFDTSSHTVVFQCILKQELFGNLTLRLAVYLTNSQSQSIDVVFYFNGDTGYGFKQLNAGLESITSFRNIQSQDLYNSSSEYIHWNYPQESFNAIYYCFANHMKQIDLYDGNAYKFPIFEVNQGDTIFAGRIQANDTHRFVFFMNRNNTSNLSNFELSSQNLSFTNYRIVNRAVISKGGTTHLMVSVDIVNALSSGFNYYITYNGNDGAHYMPVYCNTIRDKYVSMDFALQFGLSNDLLDDVHNIAVGNQETIDTSEQLDDTTSDFSESASDLFNYEDSFNDSLNDSLDDINIQFDVGNQFGSKFLASAQWVKIQFDALTSTSPFGTLLSFSLILGLALLIIGKAIK